MRTELRLAVGVALLRCVVLAAPGPTGNAAAAEAAESNARSYMLANESYRLTATVLNEAVHVRLDDLLSGNCAADGPCLYHAVAEDGKKSLGDDRLANPAIAVEGTTLTIRGKLSALDVEHRFTVPKDRKVLEERIVLRNNTHRQIVLTEFEAGVQRRVADKDGKLLPELAADRLVAVPFRRRASDAKGQYNDFSLQDVVAQPGYEPRIDGEQHFIKTPSRHRVSEGWAWTRGDTTLGIFKFCQEHVQFSVISTHHAADGTFLRFGGAAMVSDEPAALGRIAPGQTVDLGLVRFQMVQGGYVGAMYAFRAMLDEMGCRFPKDFDPPVHWEQLYDMPEAWNDRLHRYTKEIVEKEAAKGRDYSCQALYLDPGWDTEFGSLLWGEKWLGPRRQFIEEMRSKYGLKVSLHCPLATWISYHQWLMGPSAVKSFPPEARRTAPKTAKKDAEPGGKPARPGTAPPGTGPFLCLGSKQYLAATEERLLANCADGVAFLMFDGNWWNGGCNDPNHGHPLPYRREDHIRANLDLAQRVHAKYPKVLIEMHDMLAGGTVARLTPIYYKYGLRGSYDENWGFELMWNPMADIVEGRATALYYANLGCNVPIYIHVTLAGDNVHCLVLWWFASTCRHLGIGGKHADPKIVEAQQQAMKWYRAHDRFYKRGEFYGIGEEIHLHVLPEENAFTVNVFNLGGKKITIGGSMDIKALGLNPALNYVSRDGVGKVENGRYRIQLELPPWGAKAGAFGRP